jgi:peptidoglycan/LPS O-acetylase OafA/YrhL
LRRLAPPRSLGAGVPEPQVDHKRGFVAGDAIRGIAALWVIGYHSVDSAFGEVLPGGGSRDFSAEFGFLGHAFSRALFAVFVFFALSGYLLGRPFIRAYILDRSPPPVGPYAYNRLLRIVPVFALAFLVTLAVHGRNGSTWGEVAAHALFGQVYDVSSFSLHMPHTWTLDVEMVFYVLLPLVFVPAAARLGRRGTPEQRAWLLLAALGLLFAASILWRAHNPTNQSLAQPPAVAFSFAAGMAVAAAEPLIRARVTTAGAGLWWSRALLVVFAAGLAVWIWGPANIRVRATGAGIACFAIVAAPLILQWTTGRSWRAVVNPVFDWVGQRSYSLYLWHVLVVFRPFSLGADTAPGLIVLAQLPELLLSCLVAEVSYRLVERPCFNLRKKWRPNPEVAGPVEVTSPLQPSMSAR